ncbi:MAG: hypothetical protein F2934_06500 [Actinobacteria bacterium]|uniref:Unannotated protein n=1 Tax=freshwater metagenome TaxID=449393 RepID=A0A6J6QV57_9ZZZZ|nr:hypothetical protein [Actinomycetota bacterium]MSY12835.1 hypothetical protein [Actinomycetota bacterium]MSZ02850.1 hypothetical protein [Actinomycetota bacterium]MTB06763.1 hypothetical protein [Actinomycetota bacterium]
MFNRGNDVLVHLMGGLGNQLFQYTAGLQVASETGGRLYIDSSAPEGVSLADVLAPDTIAFASTRVRRSFGLSAGSDAAPARIAIRLQREWATRLGRLTIMRERPGSGLHHDGPSSGRCLLIGWFMHPSWYANTMGAVGAQLLERLREHPAYRLASTDNATVISFRRGDFVRWGMDLSSGYYENALDRLGATDAPCFVVGDDSLFLDFARHWLVSRGIAAQRVPSFEGSPGITDLAVLAGAGSVIMSNSSFCWWGVTAGDVEVRPGRTVFVPEPWNRKRQFKAGLTSAPKPLAWIPVPSTFGRGPE